VPTGVDPGWAYNPGKAWADRKAIVQEAGRLVATSAPLPVLAPFGADGVPEPAWAAFVAHPEGAPGGVQIGFARGSLAQLAGDVPVIMPQKTIEAAKAAGLTDADLRALPALLADGEFEQGYDEDGADVTLSLPDGRRLLMRLAPDGKRAVNILLVVELARGR
jgi:hypothetical protein